jgi:ribosomal protection tetracycline resistance protein
VQVRERLRVGSGADQKVTAIRVFGQGGAAQRSSVTAGEIAKLWGIGEARIGDSIGLSRAKSESQHFAPPTVETVVVPSRSADKGELRLALDQLAEQDPLINVRQDDSRQELFVSLYGEVQKEVIEATLANDYDIGVEFRETTTICIERPSGTGQAVEVLYARTKTNVTGNCSPYSSNPFPATVGLRVDPAPIGSGIEFRLDVDVRLVPLYIYKTVDTFVDHMGQYVRETLQEGICGWEVTDCIVTMIDSGYRAPGTKAGDFRKVTPLVLMSALKEAGTTVCEPVHRYHLEVPQDTLGATLPALARLDAVPETPAIRGSSCVLEGEIRAARVHELQQQLSALTRGEGVPEWMFEGYRPVRGDPPTRPRSDHNPLNRKEYLLHVARRV